MQAIDKKLWRELWNMRMQAIAIAMVIVSGVSIFVMSLSTTDSLYETRENYYRQHHFAEVFATLKRAPRSLVRQIESIPGVDKVEARVVAYITIDVEGFSDPASAHMLSLPYDSPGRLNRLFLREGRLFSRGQDNEVIVSEEFARAHGFEQGDTVTAIINGRRKSLSIIGFAHSPEYIYQIAPGALFPDHARYSVMWMAQKPLASAYNMEGAFNDVSMTLVRGTNPEDIIERLDTLLKPYGGLGAYARKDQLSNRFLSEELKQQRTIATIFPVIFFAVAAFLLNVVISRIISLEREQVGTLKAFGYSNFDVGIHYIKLVLMIVLIGVTAGTVAGIWMGQGMSNLYKEFYSLPFMNYILHPSVIVAAAFTSMLVAIIGTLYAVRRAAIESPAMAMQPEPPAVYRATFIERLGLQRWFSQPTRMILRHVERQPVKSLLTMLGLSLACGIMMIGGFQEGAIDHMVDVQYGLSQREDISINFVEPTSKRALYSLQSLEGVSHAEGYRRVSAQLRFGHRSYRTGVEGIEENASLTHLLDTRLKEIDLPPHGVVLTDYLAELLHIKVGDLLEIEVLEGNRVTLQVPVVATAKQYLGVNAYMTRRALNALLREGDAISGAHLVVDKRQQREVYTKLKEMPRIAGVVEQRSAIKAFYETMDETILFFTFITTLLGGSVAFGVVYNSMRVALSERNRELASLRVIGFKRGEVAYILLGELALLTVIALPVGLLIGHGLCAYLAFQFDSDLYRIPLVLDSSVYAFAALVVIASALISGIMIWRNLAHLDMVAVLKTRE